LRDYKRGAIPKETYINYNKIYRKLIKREQCGVFIANINNAGNNCKLKWKAIKTGLLLQAESSKINEINCEGIKIVQDEQIARTFKKHFETCAKNLLMRYPTLPVSTKDSRVQKGKLRKINFKISDFQSLLWVPRKC